MAKIIELPPDRGFDVQSIMDTFARGRAQEEQKRQFDAQMEQEKQRTDLQRQQVDQSGQMTTAQVGQISAAQAQKAGEIWRMTVYEPLIKAGQVDEANKRLGALTIAHPDVAKYAAGERSATDLDAAAANTASFAKTQTGKAASGSPDVQANNFTFQQATGQQLSGPAFGDQSQRQPEAEAVPKGQRHPAYTDYLRRGAGAMTTAAEDASAKTNRDVANIHEAGATKRQGMQDAASLEAAKLRTAPSAPASYDLASLDPGTRAKVDLIASYKMSPQSLSLRTDKKTGESERSHIIALAHLVNPDFDEKNYGIQASTGKDFAVGKAAVNIRSLNTAVGHLDQLDTAADALENGNIQVLNRLANAYKVQTGQSAPVVFGSVKNAVSGELASLLKGTGGTDTEIAHMNETIGAAQSPEQIHSAVSTYMSVIHSRLNALATQRQMGMGEIKDYKILSPEASHVFQKHGIEVDTFTSGKGGPSSGSTVTTPDGKKWRKNADGSMTAVP